MLLSSSAVPEGAPGLGEPHRIVRASVPETTVLCPSWFMQNFLGDHPHAHSARIERFVAAGYPPDFSALLAGLDADIAGGAEDRTTSTVQDVTGRPPRSFREVVGEVRRSHA